MFEKKEGQVTVFIIVAVLVVAGVVLYFVLSEGSSENKNLGPGAEKVNSYVEDCLKSSSKNSIKRVASRGGYHKLPKNKADFYSSEPQGIPRYWVVGEPEKSALPSKESLQGAVSESIKENIGGCIDGFRNLSDQYSISSGEKDIASELNEGEMNVDMNYPLTIDYQDRTINIEEFSVNVGTRLSSAYSASERIVERQKGSELAPLGFVSNMAYEENFNFDTFRLGNDMIYTLYFGEGSESLKYRFSIKYDWEAEND